MLRSGPPRGSTGSSALRILAGVMTVLAAAAFLPLGLVLDGGAWVAATAVAWVVAAVAIRGLVRQERVALAAPVALVLLWLAIH